MQTGPFIILHVYCLIPFFALSLIQTKQSIIPPRAPISSLYVFPHTLLSTWLPLPSLPTFYTLKTAQPSHPPGNFSEPVRVKLSFAPQIILVDSSSMWYFHYLFICLPPCKFLTYLSLYYQYLTQYLNNVTFHTYTNNSPIRLVTL